MYAVCLSLRDTEKYQFAHLVQCLSALPVELLHGPSQCLTISSPLHFVEVIGKSECEIIKSHPHFAWIAPQARRQPTAVPIQTMTYPWQCQQSQQSHPTKQIPLRSCGELHAQSSGMKQPPWKADPNDHAWAHGPNEQNEHISFILQWQWQWRWPNLGLCHLFGADTNLYRNHKFPLWNGWILLSVCSFVHERWVQACWAMLTALGTPPVFF